MPGGSQPRSGPVATGRPGRPAPCDTRVAAHKVLNSRGRAAVATQ